MTILLWVGQVALALLLLHPGITKSTQTKQWLLAKGQTGVANVPMPLLRCIGVSEIMDALGLIGPWLLGSAPALTPVAAACLGLVMVLAAIAHFRLRESRTALQLLPVLIWSSSSAWASPMEGRCSDRREQPRPGRASGRERAACQAIEEHFEERRSGSVGAPRQPAGQPPRRVTAAGMAMRGDKRSP